MAQIEEARIGYGWDVHRLGERGKPLVVAGLKIPGVDVGPVAHTDGDAALHAIIDALYGVMADGDIGSHYPDTDPRYRNIASVYLLRHTLRTFWRRRYKLLHLDLTVILDEPPLAQFREKFQRYLSEILSLAKERVSIKFKRTEGVFATKVYAAQCVVLAYQEPR
ncbi:MAG: 2-C-methyl-D-erythritol 2,4-cyclodiphosphate synthase [Planctomycetota bacterium]|nr:MAG: 2-C-methyl-D-erythritol 2,4-cyclodiphosphate synthase [Planctomycetota bacterium]